MKFFGDSFSYYSNKGIKNKPFENTARADISK